MQWVVLAGLGVALLAAYVATARGLGRMTPDQRRREAEDIRSEGQLW